MIAILAHLTAVGTAAFAVPTLIVVVVLARRGTDQSERALARRRRAIARRATVREYWTLERRGDGWVVVDARQDTAPDVEPVAAPTPWAEMPGGNGNGRPKHEVRDVIASLARAHQHD